MTNDQLAELTPGSLWRHKTTRRFYILEDARQLTDGNPLVEPWLVNYYDRETARPYAATWTDWLESFDRV